MFHQSGEYAHLHIEGHCLYILYSHSMSGWIHLTVFFDLPGLWGALKENLCFLRVVSMHIEGHCLHILYSRSMSGWIHHTFFSDLLGLWWHPQGESMFPQSGE